MQAVKPKGDGVMQAVKRDCNAPFTHNLNAWLRGRQSIDLNPIDLNRTDRQTWLNRLVQRY